MNAEQKKIALECIRLWGSEDLSDCAGDQMAALLQELVDAHEQKPVARVTGYYAGYLSIATVDGRVLPAGTALYTAAQPAPSVLDELSGRFTDPAKLAADLPTWENGDDPLVGGGLISRGVVDFATVGIWPTKPAPSVPDGHVHVHVSGSTGSGKSAVAGEIEIAMRAIGLDVEWVDSESEKHLTHADYTSALELYRPKVRIFEKNISRTAPPAPSVPDGWRLVPYTPTVQMLERAGYAVNNRPQPSKYEPSATPAIIFWTAMLNYAPEAPAVQADLRDAELLDWLQNNFYHRQMSDWDARQRSGQNMWVFFAPKNVQSDVREVLRAAIAAEKGGTR